MSDLATAKAFIDEAINALAIEMYRGRDLGDMQKVDPIEATIAEELDRVDRALGPRGQSMFAPLADNVRQAMTALYGAKNALEAKP